MKWSIKRVTTPQEWITANYICWVHFVTCILKCFRDLSNTSITNATASQSTLTTGVLKTSTKHLPFHTLERNPWTLSSNPPQVTASTLTHILRSRFCILTVHLFLTDFTLKQYIPSLAYLFYSLNFCLIITTSLHVCKRNGNSTFKLGQHSHEKGNHLLLACTALILTKDHLKWEKNFFFFLIKRLLWVSSNTSQNLLSFYLYHGDKHP